MALPAPPAGAEPPANYGLPPLPSLPCPDYRGPTPWSNWVIKGRLLAGAYPASLEDDETERILTTLLELGVNTFVCLQAEFSLHTPESAWRSGQGLRPYIKDAQQILIRARETRSHRIKQDKLDFLHLPIIDGNVTSDTALSRLADDCCARLLRGERMYIHCWGGHGRTGTLLAVMLGRLYGVTCSAALRFTQAFHDSRRFPQGVRSPQTAPQLAQVKRLLPDPHSCRGVAFAWDPAAPLDDTILRPASTPPSPVPAAPRSPTAPAAGVEAGGVAAPPPLNQLRKEAIRARQGGGASAVAASAACITAGLQAASLQPGGGAAPVPGRGADWLAGVFDKGSGRLAGVLRSAGGGGAAAKSAPGAPAPGSSYLQQYVQHQQELAAKPDAAAGKAASQAGGRPLISLSASSRLSADACQPGALQGCEPVDMRPSTVTVAVPEAGEAECSASSMARMLNYFSGRPTPIR